jgi:arginyl-tRNA synthetase
MFHALSSLARKTLAKDFSVQEMSIDWTIPRELSHGDLSTNVALQVAKQAGQPPRVIAEALAKVLRSEPDVEAAEVAGAGYVNIRLKSGPLLKALSGTVTVLKPKKASKEDAPVIVDYSAPNIAKPLGIHHILSTVIGQSLVNVSRHLGDTVIGINHLGDWGTQFGKLAVGLKKWGKKPLSQCSLDDLLQMYVAFHDAAEKQPELEDEARETFRKIERGDPELKAFWKEVVAITMRELDSLYKRLHVSFDHVHGESFYQGKMDTIVAEGKKKKVFTEGKEGALIVEFPEETGLSPAVVMKGDDATIYLTRDLATARYRIDTFHPREILYVVDVAQEYYFRQLFATLQRLGWELPHLEHVIFGRMRFQDRKMSTRKGNILKLEEVLDEGVTRAKAIIKERGDGIQTDDPEDLAEMMGTGAVVYSILSQNRKMDLVFDWDKMLSFEGNSAPYLQYTHARAKSVLRKAEAPKSVKAPKTVEAIEDGERLLIRSLLQFESALEEARKTRMPHKLANYLYQLCQDYNAFYNALPIVKAEQPARDLRLFLTSLTADVLRTGAGLLTLRVPERM